jgi:hypothetical protein
MPPPFTSLSIEDLAALLQRFPFRRRISSVHMHHTWRPNHAQWRGHDSIVGMWRFHTQERGFSDIAQHLTIAPDGVLWTGRDWNTAPASAKGFNGNESSIPFMFEIVGDFDRGRDRLEGAQRRAVLDVIKLVQARFGLSPETLHFHNEMADKTCPGDSLDRNAWIADVRAHPLPGGGGPRAAAAAGPFGPEALAINASVSRAIERLQDRRGGARGEDPLDAELDYGDESRSALVAEAREARGEPDVRSPEVLDTLRRHVINLRMGRYSEDGLLSTTPADVEAIFHEHLSPWVLSRPGNAGPAPVVLFAHGGLVAESAGLSIARKHVAWWLRNGVYPIYFVWETGFFETIGQLLERTRRQASGDGEGQRGFGTDWLSDPLIEEAVRALQTPRIWGGMKASARLASAPGGGATDVAEHLGNLWKDLQGRLSLHAVGHSAGSIFHAHFLPACARAGIRFDSLQLLAPAVTCEEFKDQVLPLVGSHVDRVTLFTMRKDFEKQDDTAKIYRKSLLYLVSEACEPERKTPILGLEVSLRDDPALKEFFGLGAPAAAAAAGEVVWSKSAVSDGRSASESTTHGGFDDDPATMNSVVRRILGRADADAIERYQGADASRGLHAGPLVDWPEPLANPPRTSVPAGPVVAPASPIPAAVAAASGGGRRRAVCIGIDSYPNNPLACCVADAALWSQTLRGFGYEIAAYVTNGDATRQRIVDELRRLLRESRAGDNLVFQFAGHGTKVDDLDGDEPWDTALCPVDFDSGAFLIDDDIADELKNLPGGVQMTFFLDCCHSGTGTRFAVGPGGPRERSIYATPRLQAAHRSFRAGEPRASGRAGSRNGSPMREVTFSACLVHEVALEVDGQGEFTRRAHEVIRKGVAGLTNGSFQDAVLQAFGPGARQQPQLDCDTARRGDAWLGLSGR